MYGEGTRIVKKKLERGLFDRVQNGSTRPTQPLVNRELLQFGLQNKYTCNNLPDTEAAHAA